MNKITYVSLAVLSSLALAIPAFAQTSATAGVNTEVKAGLHLGMMGRGDTVGMRPGVVGTVTAINGNTITVTSMARMGWGKGGKDTDNDGDEATPSVTPTPVATPSPTVYTIDATSAKVTKAGAASTVSAIAVGDMVMVQGTVTGTNVVATAIRDGVEKGPKESPKPMPTPVIAGNGQPIIAGSVTAISGNSITITNKSNVTYTVDASNAKVESKNKLTTLSTVAVGDNVVVQGTVNGTSVVAYSVTDQGKTTSTPSNSHPGFFGKIGDFFHNLFGF